MIAVDKERCVGCGQCVTSCPTDALSVWGVAEVKSEACTECLVCVDYCPVDALEVAKESK